MARKLFVKFSISSKLFRLTIKSIGKTHCYRQLVEYNLYQIRTKYVLKNKIKCWENVQSFELLVSYC